MIQNNRDFGPLRRGQINTAAEIQVIVSKNHRLTVISKLEWVDLLSDRRTYSQPLLVAPIEGDFPVRPSIQNEVCSDLHMVHRRSQIAAAKTPPSDCTFRSVSIQGKLKSSPSDRFRKGHPTSVGQWAH